MKNIDNTLLNLKKKKKKKILDPSIRRWVIMCLNKKISDMNYISLPYKQVDYIKKVLNLNSQGTRGLRRRGRDVDAKQ